MHAFENGTVTEEMFGERVRELGRKAQALRVRREELLGEAAADEAPVPTPRDLEDLRAHLIRVAEHGPEPARKMVAQAFVHSLVVEARDRIQPTFKIPSGLMESGGNDDGAKPGSNGGVRAMTPEVVRRIGPGESHSPRDALLNCVSRVGPLIGTGMDERRAGELVELAETAEPHLYGPGQREWRARLNAHAEEIEEALRFLLDAGAADAAMRMAGALRLYWMDTGRVDQGREWLGSALDTDGGPSLARARALVAAGELAFRQGDQEAARSHTAEALRLAELLEDRSTAALAHTNLARVALREGDAPAIERHARDGIDASGNDLYARSRAVHMLAWAAYTAGEAERAREVFMESLRLRRQLGDHLGEAIELSNLGDLARAAGQVDASADFLLQALEIAVELDSRYLLPGLLASLAVLAGQRGDLERAARLLGASQAQYEAAGLVPDPVDSHDPDRMRELVLEKLGVDRFQTLSGGGRRMSLYQAVAEARAAAD